MLLDRGLGFDAVVRGLVIEVGISAEQATRAAVAATTERPLAHTYPWDHRMDNESPIMHSAEVNQAAGVVSVQADCLIEQAFAVMFERAETVGVSIDDIAAAVLDHSIALGCGPLHSGRETA